LREYYTFEVAAAHALDIHKGVEPVLSKFVEDQSG